MADPVPTPMPEDESPAVVLAIDTYVSPPSLTRNEESGGGGSEGGQVSYGGVG